MQQQNNLGGDMKEYIKIIQQIMHEFVREESGNKVTVNNIMALNMKVNMVLKGEITLTAPVKKEK
jgi:hypothetical protein